MRQKWRILISVACGTFMATLDSSIVNVALPSITASLHTGLVTSRWVIISYLFSITGLLLFFGKLADGVGRKNIFILGYLTFTLGSILCGFSTNISQLIVFRAFQGLGAAMLMANGPALIAAAFPSTERGKALGILAMVVSCGLMVGPTFGGALVRLFNWPSIFFINIPIGILGTYLVYRYVPAAFTMVFAKENEEETDHITKNEFEREKSLPWQVRLQLTINRLRYFDWLGAVLWFIIQLAYSLAIDKENVLGLAGSLQRIISFSSLGLLLLFIIWEWSVKDPILDLTLFKSRTFLIANVSGIFNFIAISSVMLLMPFYFQNVQGLPPHKVGVFMSALPVAMFFIAPVSGRLSDIYGSRILSQLGMALICLSLFFFSVPNHGLGNSHPYLIILALIVIGIGQALFQTPNNNAIMSSVERSQLGVASALLATVRNFGMVTGAALSTGFLMYFYNIETINNKLLLTPTINFVAALRMTFMSLAILCSSGIILGLFKDKEKKLPCL